MRELKFRAWNGKWMVTPQYGDWISFDGVPYTEAENTNGSWNVEIQKAKDYVLMQYTGLKDKNDKPIFEGDLILIENTKITLVSWDEKFGSFCLKNDTWMFKHWFGEAVNHKECEVIGNIYENPELLK